ncbi:hypothetical protein [Nocardia sp. CC227C]|uniref:hypothetical protein n=1 Tax=Nocardia sp. CC227C TaxID=3044562 RepID=UPI00278C8E8E|nr:hypothetical protein [Nocardia sp. CC227C]
MTMPEPDDLQEVRFRNHQPREKAPPPGYEAMGDTFIKPEYRAFIKAAMEGRLPDLGELPEPDPEVVQLTAELQILHLPEWRAANGRKIAEPTVKQIPGAPRVADWLVQRGWRWHPEHETVRWFPTPGVAATSGDPGKFAYRHEDGSWPDPPDLEAFWDVDEIECHQLEDGRWAAVHPRGIQCTDASKAEALGMCIDRVRAKIAELRENS